MYDYDQAIKYYNDGLEAKLKYELLRRLYHHKREYVKAIETYDKAIKIRRRVQSESHTTLESIVYTRNALQEYVQNYPEQIFEYDSSNDEEPMFQSFAEAINYMNKHRKTNEDQN